MADEMLEVEMKFPVADLAALETRLKGSGARPGPVVEEADSYYNAPDRDFARTDEALRIRRVGDKNFVTYKGPKLDAQTKTRVEREARLADGREAGEEFGRILEHLGYRPVAVVQKRRQKYGLQVDGFKVEASLDTVHQVGTFAELEIIAPKGQLDQAKAAVLKLAGELGLTGTERRSYLELLLKGRGS